MKSKKFSVMLSVILCPLLAQAEETPDYSKESKFHSIYKSYNEQPTSVESWEKAVGSRQSEVYQVQKGDTLSGISTTLFGDPFFWPKIWSLNNSKILNPHEIVPGLAVQFYPGSSQDIPTLQLGQEATAAGSEEVTAAATPAEPSQPANQKNPEVAPSKKKRTPVLASLPASLPQQEYLAAPDTSVGMQLDLSKTTFPAPVEYLTYYITDAPVEGVGVITGAEMGLKVVGEYQYVFVRLDGASGKNFVIQKNLSMVTDPQNKSRKGQMVEVQGELEILEKVSSEKNIYRAIVSKAIGAVEVGAVLTPGQIPVITPQGSGQASGVTAKIMGGQFDKKRSLFGSSSLVFLDSGSAAGLQEGQTLPIFADERVRNKNTDAVENDRVIGSAKIVRVTSNFATAFVVNSSEGILVGDYVGKSTGQATVAPSSEEETPEAGTDDSLLEL